MNYISIAMMVFTALPIVCGLLFGLLRGSRYSIARLIVVAVCLIAALLLRQPVTEWVMGLNVGGQTIEQSIVSAMPEEMSALGDTVVIFVKLLASAVLFVLLFGVTRLLTALILGPILKAIVNRRSKGVLGGGLIGLVQGVLVALVICIPLSGVMTEMNSVLQNESLKEMQSTTAYVTTIDRFADVDPNAGETDGGGTADGGMTDGEQGNENTVAEIDIAAMLDEYSNSTLGKLYTSVGAKPFELVSSMTVDGKKYTLPGQVDAINGGIDMIYALQRLGELGDDILGAGSITTVNEVFSELDKVWKALPNEAKETIQNVVVALVDSADTGVDLSKVDLTKVDFANEGKVFDNLQRKSTELADKDSVTLADIKDVIDEAAKSDVILPIIAQAAGNESTAFTPSDEAEAANVRQYIDSLDVSADQKTMLQRLCGVGEKN